MLADDPVPAIRWGGRLSPLEASVAERFCQCKLWRFRAKWTLVRVKKTRQDKNLERGSDSIRIAI
jgi:hypothetical protein